MLSVTTAKDRIRDSSIYHYAIATLSFLEPVWEAIATPHFIVLAANLPENAPKYRHLDVVTCKSMRILRPHFWFFTKPGNRLLVLLLAFIWWQLLLLLEGGVRLSPDEALLLILFLVLGVCTAWTIFNRVTAYREYWFWLVVISGVLLWVTVWHTLVAQILAVLIMLYLRNAVTTDAPQTVKGRQLETVHNARRTYDVRRAAQDPGLLWGGARLPLKDATTHFLVVGASGSGKTLTLRLLMQSLLPYITRNSGRRGVIYDAKRDTLSLLAGMNLSCKIAILNPFDVRGMAWDIARDITTYSDAEALADILLPREENEDDFFRSATFELLKAVVQCFIDYAPGAWTLRDVVLAMRSQPVLQFLINSHPETRHLQHFFASDKTAANIMATVATKIGRYRTIAALWSSAGRQKISLQEWLHGDMLLILGKDNSAEVALNALNQLLFTRMAQLVLNGPDVAMPQTFFFLDELPRLGKLDKLTTLCTEGRSKGVCLAAGLQSIEELRHTYGAELAHTMSGQFQHKAVLRLNDEPTADWASKHIGDAEICRLVESTSYGSTSGWSGGTSFSLSGSNSRTTNINPQYSVQRAVFASELMAMQPVSQETGDGLTGYYLGRAIYRHTYTLRELDHYLKPKQETYADFVPISAEHQRLHPWGPDDVVRLNTPQLLPLITPPPNTKPPETPPAPA